MPEVVIGITNVLDEEKELKREEKRREEKRKRRGTRESGGEGREDL